MPVQNPIHPSFLNALVSAPYVEVPNTVDIDKTAKVLRRQLTKISPASRLSSIAGATHVTFFLHPLQGQSAGLEAQVVSEFMGCPSPASGPLVPESACRKFKASLLDAKSGKPVTCYGPGGLALEGGREAVQGREPTEEVTLTGQIVKVNSDGDLLLGSGGSRMVVELEGSTQSVRSVLDSLVVRLPLTFRATEFDDGDFAVKAEALDEAVRRASQDWFDLLIEALRHSDGQPDVRVCGLLAQVGVRLDPAPSPHMAMLDAGPEMGG
jgi:hypothetical protein